VKEGDLVIYTSDDTCHSGEWCGCWFCSNNSTRLGIILERLGPSRHYRSDPISFPKFNGYWSVLFDIGEWRLYGNELEVINERL